MIRPLLMIAIPFALAACSGPEDHALAPVPSAQPKQAPAPLPSPSQALIAAAPAQPAAFDPHGAAAAAEVLKTYYALIDAKKYDEAWRLWDGDGAASGMSEAQFADSFAKYAEHRAEIGVPAEPEGAAGTVYVEVPVKLSGSLKSGWPFNMEGRMIMRRVNDVPGATEAQRNWHIASSGVRPRP